MFVLSKIVRRTAILGAAMVAAVTIGAAPANAATTVEFRQGSYPNSTYCNLTGTSFVGSLYFVNGLWRVIQGWSCRGAGGRTLYLKA